MNRKLVRRLLIALPIICAFGAALYVGFWPSHEKPEPIYEGHSLSSLLIDYPSRRNQFEQDEIAGAVRHIGTNAVPFLVEWIRAKDGPIRRAFLNWTGRHPHFPLHPNSPAYEKNMKALYGFLILGPIAKPAVPDLIELVQNGNPQQKAFAVSSLGSIGPPAKAALPALQAYVQSLPAKFKSDATDAIAHITTETNESTTAGTTPGKKG